MNQFKKYIDDKYFIGKGVDIGCGKDKIVDNAIGVDFKYLYDNEIFEESSADFIGPWEDFFDNKEEKSFDFIFSSHLLEDYINAYKILEIWANYVKLDGYLILVLPIEPLYKEFCDKTNEVPNQAHKFVWDSPQAFVDKMSVHLDRHFDVVELSEVIENYSFYVVLKRKEPKQNGIIYLTYNSEHSVRLFLSRLLLFRTGNTDIIAIDNNSQDNTVAAINSFGVECIKLDENIGFSRGINVGLKIAQEKQWEWAFIINPDVGVYIGWDDMFFSSVPKEASIIGVKLMSDGAIHHTGGDILRNALQQFITMYLPIEGTNLYVLSEVPYGMSRFSHRISHSESSLPEKIPWVTFAAVAIRMSLVDKIGLLNEDYFLYNSDSEYCLRAWASDEPVYYNPVTFDHVVGGSSNKNGDWLWRIVREDAKRFMNVENQLILDGGNKWRS